MATINLHAAKTNLSKLIKRVENGEEIILARDGRPVARLAPLRQNAEAQAHGPRGLGLLAGMHSLPDGFFFDPLPEDELNRWNGGA